MAAPYEAQFIAGSPAMVDHTPVGAIAAGEVVVTADTTRIAHRAIPAGTLGALAAGDGSGEYEVPGNAAIAVDKKVYWDNAANQITENAAAGANKVFGVTLTACTGAAAFCRARHDVGV